MPDFLYECMSIAIKGTIGMLCIMVILIITAAIFLGAIEFFKVLFTSPKKPGPEAASEATTDAALEEEEPFTIIDGGKKKDGI